MEYTKYEKARMIGSRALQISMGAPFLIKIDKDELEALKYNPVEIAKKEFAAGAFPITIKRPYPDTRKKEDEVDEDREDKDDEKEEDEEQQEAAGDTSEEIVDEE